MLQQLNSSTVWFPHTATDIQKVEKEVGKPSETDSIKSQISSKVSRGKKKTAQKDAIKDITSDSQVNCYFPYWRTARNKGGGLPLVFGRPTLALSPKEDCQVGE